MDKLGAMLNHLPSFYNKDTTSSLYNFIKAFADEYELQVSQLSRADNMVGIDTTNDADLEYRWGKLLHIPRIYGESEISYRSRLKNSITSLSGGTAQAIKYAIAIGLGINDDPIKMDQMINIYDAWEYDGDDIDPADKIYGHIVCKIDLSNEEYTPEMEDIVIDRANDNKSAGTVIHFTVSNYRIIYYIGLDDITYINLNSIKYDKLG